MKIFRIQVENYRLLKKFTIDLEDELSLVIGKNNTGKTSLLQVLDKFLNHPEKFTFYDFNIEFKKELKSLIENAPVSESEYKSKGITLKIFIKYNEDDDLSNISRVMMDLDPDNNVIVLGFEYAIYYSDYENIRKDFSDFKEKEEQKKISDDKYQKKTTYDFINKNISYFKSRKYSYDFNNDNGKVIKSNYIDLDNENISIKDIINFKYISARRDVTNKEADKALSGQTSKIYDRTEANEKQTKAIENFKDQLSDTDNNLSNIYTELFKDIVKKVEIFGGIKPSESEIQIISTLQHRELLKGNTTVVYKHDEENQLPEHYNGLGYMNLISMIFEIDILVQEFKGEKDKKPSDINLLFIEEPEAHTHPQMQYVFIKNIKKLLQDGIHREDGQHRTLQYIISTHSSHIVADSDFNDIKYLLSKSKNEVEAKNLKDLEKEYLEKGEEQNFRFLKQYLTLHRAELFFADKAIFIEGDTERILLPAMMKKIDQQLPDNPMLSQNISIIEVGAHSQIFEKFIDFIGLQKGLIITDIDSYYLQPLFESDGKTPQTYKNGNPKSEFIKCFANDVKAEYTSNNALKFFFNKTDIAFFKDQTFTNKILAKRDGNWIQNEDGKILIVYQTEINGLHPRSFEDAFFELNRDFIVNSINSFPSLTLKWLKKFRENEINSYEFSDKAVTKKPPLAIEILLNSKTTGDDLQFSNWEIPQYIKQGLTWLKKD